MWTGCGALTACTATLEAPRLVGASITQHDMLADSYPHTIVQTTSPGGEATMGPMAIVHHLGSEIRARGMRATMTYGFSTESLILKSFRIGGPIGTGGGMYNGGMTPTKRFVSLTGGESQASVLAFSLLA
jgi:hypothetical protein